MQRRLHKLVDKQQVANGNIEAGFFHKFTDQSLMRCLTELRASPGRAPERIGRANATMANH